MRVPLSWLADYVDDLPPLDELARRLTMAGLEVEDVRRPDPALVENLVVARIENVARHPEADRLSLCQVDTGAGVRQIVCGARNMKAGDAVVLASPGAALPNGLKIKKAKIRGQESNGMLCSAAELGLDDGADGIIILDSSARAGESAAALLGLADAVFEIAVTPNRGDCLSIRGLAREVAAVCGARLREAMSAHPARPVGASRFSIRVSAPAEACPLYRGLEVRDVRIGPSPAWLRSRLIAAGLRPINNVVDVTNYVLIDRGQPLHAFDADLLEGDTIEVAALARAAELETLDGQTRNLVAGDLVICDRRGPVALAGVMGGMRTAVHGATTSLLLEAAGFRPASVRATSRRLGLVSESSMRFERGVDGDGVEDALLEAARMIVELGGGRVAGGIAAGGAGIQRPDAVRVRPARTARVLGVNVEPAEMERLMRSVGGEVGAGGEGFSVRAPSYRHDLTREADWIEEIARLRGYETIPEAAPAYAMSEATAPVMYGFEARARERLAALGLTETVGLAFASAERNELLPGLHARSGAIDLRNPLRAEAAQMRRSLLTTLIDAHQVNARGGVAVTDLFSVGRTFARGGEREEIDAVGGLLAGPRRARGPGDAGPPQFWDVKAVVERIAALTGADEALAWQPAADRREYHPRASAVATLAGRVLGYAGKIHPDVADALAISQDICVFEVDSLEVVSYAPPRRSIRPVPRYPASSRDVSLLVPEGLLAGDVIHAVGQLGEPLIEHVRVFDEYTGEGVPAGQRALAFSIVYRAADRTLTDDEVAALHEGVVSSLCKRLEVRRRFE